VQQYQKTKQLQNLALSIILFKIIMLRNNLIILNPKQLVLNPELKYDKLIIEHKMKNTYYDKIIRINNEDKKNIKK
jgi:hypothetical protein